MSATVCVDAGTTLIKAVVFDDDGRELVVARRPTELSSPHPGWSEQDMDAVLTAVAECVSEAAERSAEPVGALAVTAQGDGAWLVDEAGTPVRPAVLWNDARAKDVVDAWTRDGTLESAFRRNGSLGNLGLPHSLLAWFAGHEKDALTRSCTVVTCGSWLFGSLTGSGGLHPSEASAPWLDVSTGAVSDDLIEQYGLAAWRRLVPAVLGPGETTQPLRPEAAARMGLPAGLPVTLAPYDVVTTGAGGGAVRPGDAFCILGTTLCTGVLMERPDTTGVPSGLTLLGPIGDPVVRAFPTLAGTGVLDWLARLLRVGDPIALVELAAESAAGAGGVRMWPYLSPAGERAPFLDPAASGLLAGLNLLSTPADLARSALEGLAHVIRDCLEAAGPLDTAAGGPAVLTLSGGGSGSDLWCQTISDVTGVPVRRAGDTQAGAKGALLYAVVAAGDSPSLVDAAARLVAPGTDFAPDPDRRALFDVAHEEFLAFRDLAGDALVGLGRRIRPVTEPGSVEPAWIGIDLGTQSVRALALDDQGRQLGAEAVPLTSRRDAGRHEQDPEGWWTGARDALRRLTGALPAGVVPRALAVSGTSGTLVSVSRTDGTPTGAGVMYDDRRGAAALPLVLSAGAELFARLGYRVQASWALPKVVTLVRAGALGDGELLAHQPDVVTSRLAGRLLPSDLSSALKSGADLDAVTWPDEVLERLGLRAAQLNALARSGDVIGEVGPAAAAETGLPVGCAIVAGMTDGCAAQIAAGALAPGAWNSVLGTTLVLKGAARERRTDPTGAVYAHRAPFDGGWYPGGASSTGAGALTHWLPERDLAALSAQLDPEAPTPLAYPLVGRGERFPFVAEDAVALFDEGVLEGSDVRLLAAILAGVAWVERLAFDLVDLVGYDAAGPVLLTGGGARNPRWNQRRADVLGRTLQLPTYAEGAAGMAVLAAAGAAAHDDPAQPDPLTVAAARLLPPSRPVEPDPARHPRLMADYGRFLDVLEPRGWVHPELLDHARTRAAA